MARLLSRLRRGVAGQAGPGPAWALAATAAFTMLVSVALPRVIANAQNHSVRQAVAGMPSLTAGVAVSAQWHPFAGDRGTVLTLAQTGQMSDGLAAAVPPPLTAPAGQRWTGVTAPSQIVVNPAPSTVLHGPPVAEVAYRSGLTTHARLIAGSWPGQAGLPGAGEGKAGGATSGQGGSGQGSGGQAGGAGRRPGAAGCPVAAGRPAILAVAATASTAARFGLRPGSTLDLCPYQAGDPAVGLRVTGVVRPVSPGSAFWQYDPVLTTPQLRVVGTGQILFAGLLLGPGELAALQTAYSGAGFEGTWFYPLDLHRLTASAIGKVQSALAGLASSGLPAAVAGRARTQFTGPPVATSGLGGALTAFTAQVRAATGVDALFATGLDATAVVLLLVCAWLAVRAHAGELALLRARGGSTGQAARRMFGRGAAVTIPALAVATAVSVVTVPANSPAGWQLGGATAVLALAAPAAIAAWVHRRSGSGGDRAGGAGPGMAAVPGRAGRLARAGRRDSGGGRPGRQRAVRRVIAEVFVLAVTAASLIALRRRGLSSGSDPFLAATPVLAALAAGVAAARVVPAVLRPLLAAAGRRRGAVAFLGLAAAVRTRAVALPAALALSLALTLAAFGLVVAGSVDAGQSAAAWRAVGADVVVQAAGGATVSHAAETAIARVPGVRHTAAVYAAGARSPLAATLGSQPVGLVVVNPARYAALSADTPWPGFPAALLTGPRRAGARGPETSGARAGPVPVLASAAVAPAGTASAGVGGKLAARGLDRATVVLDGAGLPVVVAGRIGTSPAMPAGGPYLVLPDWAAPRLPSLPGPQTLLVTGGSIDLAALHAATAHYLPGSRVTVRRQVLAELAGTPATRASAQVYTIGIWASAALAAVAVLFALLATASSRGQLLARLAALGMARRDSRVLALTAAVPLLCVGLLAMVAAVLLLSATTGPALNLAVFTGAGAESTPVAGAGAVLAGPAAALTAAGAPAPLRPGPAALLIPAALVCVLAGLILAGERAVRSRRTAAAAVRHEDPAAVGVEEG